MVPIRGDRPEMLCVHSGGIRATGSHDSGPSAVARDLPSQSGVVGCRERCTAATTSDAAVGS